VDTLQASTAMTEINTAIDFIAILLSSRAYQKKRAMYLHLCILNMSVYVFTIYISESVVFEQKFENKNVPSTHNLLIKLSSDTN
jgi:small ligand-binding sensory domain FIST